MKTDVITITSEGNNVSAALKEIDKLCAYKELSHKSAISLRLLTEEMMAMMRAITGDLDGEFWVEDNDGKYELHLMVNTLVDEKSRKQLLSAASSGKNEATRGFMGKIRSFFEPAAGMPVFTSGFYGGAPESYGDYVWSMELYREELKQYMELNKKKGLEDWDELEKSVVARVADDVKVSIRGQVVEMTIIKKVA